MFGSRKALADPGLGKERFATLISEHTTIRGDLELSDGIRVDGQLHGNARRRGDAPVTVVIGPTGKITGTVEAARVVVAGTVLGNIVAEDGVDLQASALVQGDVQCRSLRVAHGARLTGRVLTGDQPVANGKPVLVIDQGEVARVA